MTDRWTFVLNEDSRILFVDDDPILTEFAKVHLATPTTTVEAALDGEEALALLSQKSFDFVLLDIEMPKLDGFELLHKLRSEPRFAHLPVMILTGREDIASIDRAFQLGADSFVTKPINWRQLSYSIRYVMRTKRMERDLVHERKRSDDLLQLTNSLLSLIRMEARTPLSAILGFCECITQQIDGPVGESYLRYAEQIGAAARQLQDNFMDLIQYAQLTAGSVTLSEDEYPASKLLDAVTTDLSLAPAQQERFEAQRPAENFYILCDLKWLARAVRHFIEFVMNDGSRVEVSMSPIDDGGALLTIVANTVDGAAVRQATSLASVRHELGMGVAFARCVVELHGGAFLTERREDGAVVTQVRIPPKGASASDRGFSTTEAA